MVAPHTISDRVIAGVLDRTKVQGLTHGFYKYPARFSPSFARAVIDEYTAPGDLVADPFMGGGTTAVEALASGRRFLGTDTSRLAHFVTDTKTTILSPDELGAVLRHMEEFVATWTIGTPSGATAGWMHSGYLRNLRSRDTWRLSSIIGGAIESAEALPTGRQRRFARAIVLRTAQRAIDTRREFPSIDWFRQRLIANATEMTAAMQEFAARCGESTTRRRLLLRRPAETLALAEGRHEHPRLILTSPPYPNVHVLYHRWQLNGGKETPAPFWIAGVHDGDPTAHYTLAGRHDEDGYFRRITETFTALRILCDERTLLVQLVAFRSMDEQLPRYLAAMQNAGFEEFTTIPIVREVPSRRWYATDAKRQSDSSREVALFHRMSSPLGH